MPRAWIDIRTTSAALGAALVVSLLALLADGERGGPSDGPIGEFMRLPVTVRFDPTLAPLQRDEIAFMSEGEVRCAPRPGDAAARTDD